MRIELLYHILESITDFLFIVYVEVENSFGDFFGTTLKAVVAFC